jgi:hypothetical protein
MFQSYDFKKSIANVFENEDIVMGLVDMLSLLILQLAKKDTSFYPPTR